MKLPCATIAYTLGPALRTLHIKNLGTDLALERLRTCPPAHQPPATGATVHCAARRSSETLSSSRGPDRRASSHITIAHCCRRRSQHGRGTALIGDAERGGQPCHSAEERHRATSCQTSVSASFIQRFQQCSTELRMEMWPRNEVGQALRTCPHSTAEA